MCTRIPGKWIWCLLFGFYFLVGCAPSSGQPLAGVNAPDWQGIVPGQTSPEQVVEILGVPDESGQDGRLIWYRYNDFSKSRPDSIWMESECNCVRIIQVNWLERHRDDPIVLQEMFDTYGEPEAVTQANYPGRAASFIYATQGIEVIAQRSLPAEKAAVLAISYFPPVSLDEYMASWGLYLDKDVSFCLGNSMNMCLNSK